MGPKCHQPPQGGTGCGNMGDIYLPTEKRPKIEWWGIKTAFAAVTSPDLFDQLDNILPCCEDDGVFE